MTVVRRPWCHGRQMYLARNAHGQTVWVCGSPGCGKAQPTTVQQYERTPAR